MNRAIRLAIAGVLTVGIVFSAEMSGYISDAACGWNNARPGKEAKECATKCVQGGWDPVFVKDGQMDVLKIKDKKAVLPYVGDHVVLVGVIKGDTVAVTKIRKTAKPEGTPRAAK